MKKSWWGNILSDKEFWLILTFNLAILISYFYDQTSASTIVLLYYLQSVLIGVQYFTRLLFLAKKQGTSYGLPFFFAFHYGFFHFVYLFFLITMISDLPGAVDYNVTKYLLFALLANTLFSTISDIRRDRESPATPAFVMFQPYLRIVPMHLLIIFGFNSESDLEWAFLLFIGLKTIADAVMHIIVNKTYLQRRPSATGGWI